MHDISLASDGRYHRWPRPAEYVDLRGKHLHWPSPMAGAYCIAPCLNILLQDDTISGEPVIPRRFGRTLLSNDSHTWSYGDLVYGDLFKTLVNIRFSMEVSDFPDFDFKIVATMSNQAQVPFAAGSESFREWPVQAIGPDLYSRRRGLQLFAFVGSGTAKLELQPATLKDQWADDPEN